MSVRDKLPRTLSYDPDDFNFWERQFHKNHEPYPVEHLVGRVTHEEQVASAEAAWEVGHKLGDTALELLRQSQEFVFGDDGEIHYLD